MACAECISGGVITCKEREMRLRAGVRPGHCVSCLNLNLIFQNCEKLLNGVELGNASLETQ